MFTTSSDSIRADDRLRSPAVSAAHLEGEEFGFFTHGDAEFLVPGDPDLAWIDDHLTRHDGSSPSSWGPAMVYLRIQPRWMISYKGHDEVDGADHDESAASEIDT